MHEMRRSTTVVETAPTQTAIDFLLSDHNEETQTITDDPIVANQRELNRYSTEPQIGRNDSPLQWWQANCMKSSKNWREDICRYLQHRYLQKEFFHAVGTLSLISVVGLRQKTYPIWFLQTTITINVVTNVLIPYCLML